MSKINIFLKIHQYCGIQAQTQTKFVELLYLQGQLLEFVICSKIVVRGLSWFWKISQPQSVRFLKNMKKLDIDSTSPKKLNLPIFSSIRHQRSVLHLAIFYSLRNVF